MPDEMEKVASHEEGIDIGQELVSWDTWEFEPVERSMQWYVVTASAGLAMLLYALLTANFVFALILLMFAVLIVLKDLKRPDRLKAVITKTGILFGNDFYPFEDIRDFSLSYSPPDVKYLYVTFHGRLTPMLSIPLEDVNPNAVRSSLMPYVFENLEREGESLTDTLHRVYKL